MSAGYTLLCCGAGGCASHPHQGAVENSLRALVRHSRHGVLATGGCVLGSLLCRSCGPAGGRAEGTFVLVQPCTAQREPTGPAVAVGPLRTADDVVDLSRWLRGGELTASGLPARLRPRLDPLSAASRN